MMKSLLRTNKEITEIYERHVNTIYHVCFTLLKNPADTEDAVQNTFIRLLTLDKRLENTQHEKAWLIVTASNICKNHLRHWRQRIQPIEDCESSLTDMQPETDETLEAVRHLPDKYKISIYLYYYEGYSGAEIARMLSMPQATVRSHLNRGKKLLRKRLGGVFNEK